MANRQFLHADKLNGPLAQNQFHNFALGQTMMVYSSSALYTWIPKNACSTMRFSIAMANGCLSDLSQINWIHSNNRSFLANTESASRANYSFVILRCPFQRLFSAFMDKFVDMDIQSWQFRNARNRSFHPHDLTFRTFVKELQSAPPHSLDPHVRPQSHFLLYKAYDDYFAFESFAGATAQIERNAGLQVVDTRSAIGHHIVGLKPDITLESPADMPAFELLDLKRQGKAPDISSMYDGEIVSMFMSVFADDLALYENCFGKSAFMNQIATRA